MNGKRRMELAMHGRKPDRVPLMCQLATGHIYRNAGLAPLDYWYTAKGYVEGNIRMTEKYRFDGILSDVGEIRDPEGLSRITDVSEVSEGHIAVFDNGDRLLFPADDNPRFTNRARLNKNIDIDDVDPEAVKILQSGEEIPRHHKEVLDELLRRKESELSVHGEVGTAFEKLLAFMGSYENGLMALMDDPGKCLQILERANRSVITFALDQCGAGIDALKLSSPFAGSGFISRKMYEQFVLPFESELISAVKEKYDIPCYIHTCGKIGDRLDLIVKTGTDGIECLDPVPLGDVDLAAAIVEIGDEVFIKGNLDSVNELMNKSRNEITETLHRRIETGKTAKKGFILSTACSLSPKVPPENVALMFEAVEKYGRYGEYYGFQGNTL